MISRSLSLRWPSLAGCLLVGRLDITERANRITYGRSYGMDTAGLTSTLLQELQPLERVASLTR